jgi:conjugal transfer pilus assembly protein TraE
MACMVWGLLLANILLSTLAWYTNIHQRVLITPFASSSGFSNSDSTVDPRYLSMMSENFIYSRLNVTPETITSTHKRLLMFLDGSQYSVLQSALAKEASTVQKNMISSDFIITNLKLSLNDLKVLVTGVLHRAVGGRELKPSYMTYELSYRYQLGRLSILSFTKVQEQDHA